MAKAKTSVADASRTLYDLLESFDATERQRIINSALTLLGDSATPLQTQIGIPPHPAVHSGHVATPSPALNLGARAYIDGKSPKMKTELFAVAARYHENTQNGASATKEDLQRIIQAEGRRSFDVKNFGRDIGHAQTAKLFNKGGEKGAYTLSNIGQDFVDALPDRTKAKDVLKGSKSSRKQKKLKKKAKQIPK
jgi:hypothetical protein